jgi:hypothetical protein
MLTVVYGIIYQGMMMMMMMMRIVLYGEKLLMESFHVEMPRI